MVNCIQHIISTSSLLVVNITLNICAETQDSKLFSWKNNSLLLGQLYLKALYIVEESGFKGSSFNHKPNCYSSFNRHIS